MKKLLPALFLLLLAPALSAQTTQQGLVRELSSGKTTISGVSILFFDAIATESDGEGKFSLVFAKKFTPGSSIVMDKVMKNSYELVNEKEMQILKLSNDGRLATDIILAKAGVIATARAKYAGESTAALLAGLEREKKQLKAQYSQSKLDAKQYQKQLEALQKEFELQKPLIDKYAEEFARTNFDDVSKIYEECLLLLKNGEISKCQQKLDSLDLLNRADRRISRKKEIRQQEAENEKGIDEDIELMKLQVKADILTLKVAKAEALFDKMYELRSTDLDILIEAADFYREQHRYEKAMKLYPKIAVHPQAEEWQKANAYGHLGELFTITGDLDSAILFFEKLSSAYSDLSKDSSSFHKNGLAISYSKLGETHSALGNLDKALGFYQERSRIGKELYETYPSNVGFKNGLAISYEKLGQTHSTLGNLDKALGFYQDYSRLEKELYEAYPNNVDFKNGLAISYEKLGETHSALGNLDKALGFYQECSRIGKELYEAYPNNVDFKNELARSYSKLGETHSSLGDLNKALSFYQDFSRLEKELYQAYPNNVTFKNGLAISYFKLSTLYLESDIDKKIDYLKRAEQHFKELRVISPQNSTFKKYHEIMVNSLNQLGENGKKSGKILQNILKQDSEYQRFILYTEYISALKSENAVASEISEAFNSYAWYGLLTKQFAESEALVKQGITLDSTNKYLYTNLPAALLLQGKTEEALHEYKKWAKKPFGEQGNATYKDAFLADFKEFEAAGIIPEERKKDVAAVIKMLNEL